MIIIINIWNEKSPKYENTMNILEVISNNFPLVKT